MRLTLRTMLAYIDGILEPEQAEDIAKKIEESEFATNLQHRIRDLIQRLRLAAPSLGERQPGLDPNTVAEYLDNTLPGDRVPDFEKVCLESDIHLAEVAACHQILTLVLGEPAEIDPASRRRIYQLRRREGAEARSRGDTVVTGTSSTDGNSTGAPPLRRRRRKPTVPDYLREPPKRRRLQSAAVVLLLSVGVLVAVLAAFGEFGADRPLGKWLGLGRTEVAGRPAEGPSQPDQGVVGPGPADAPADDQGPQPPSSDAPPAGDAAPPPSEPTEPPPAATAEDGGPSEVDATPTEPSEPVLPDPASEAGPGEADAAPPEAPSPTEGDVEPGPSAPPADDRPAETPGPQIMGRFMSNAQVLLRLEAETGTWLRVPAKAILYPHVRLVALPTYRDEITLSAGTNLQLLGGAEIELLPAEGREPAGVRVSYGRMFMMPLADPGTQLRLVVGEHQGVITFTDAESIAALEVTPIREAGTNPETRPGSLAVDLYAVSGDIEWDERSGQPPVPVRAQTCLMLDEPEVQAPVPVQELPQWITGEVVGLLDRRASSTLQETLQLDRSASLGLRELTDHRQKEVRWLAARCLAYIGHFDAMVGVLNDPEYRLDWPDYVLKLQEAILRSPAMAEQVRTAMEIQYGEAAAPMYRMLWGYTEEGLRAGEARALVESLDHETLAIRRLAYWNLRNIFGLGLLYRPDDPAAKRQAPTQKWKERLESGELFNRLPNGSAPPPAEATPPPL